MVLPSTLNGPEGREWRYELKLDGFRAIAPPFRSHPYCVDSDGTIRPLAILHMGNREAQTLEC